LGDISHEDAASEVQRRTLLGDALLIFYFAAILPSLSIENPIDELPGARILDPDILTKREILSNKYGK